MDSIDAHVHLWDTTRWSYPWREAPEFAERLPRVYLLDDLLRDAAGIDVGWVFVQAGRDPAPDPVEEAAWVQDMAETHPHGNRLLAIVAYADLIDPGVAQVLDRYRDVPLVRGIRQELWWRRHPPRADYRSSDLIAEPAFRRGLGELAARGMSFDVTADPGQLVPLADLVASVPDLTVVVDHLGMPPAEPAERDLWRRGIERLAANERASIKLSGFISLGGEWTVDQAAAVAHEVVARFGPGRSMLGSNFPVDGLSRPYAELWEALEEIAARVAPGAEHDLRWGTAQRAYCIDRNAQG